MTPEAIKFVAVTPEAIQVVAVIYWPSLTGRDLHADHSGTQYGYMVVHAGSILLLWQIVFHNGIT